MLFYSEFQQSYIWLPFIGFLIGTLATMLGSGGGLFFPLILILLFQVPAQIAVATSLAAGLPLSLVGSTGNYLKGNIHFRMGIIFGLGGIAGAIAGTAFTSLISPKMLKTAFGIYSVALALLIYINMHKGKANKNKLENSKPAIPSHRKTFAGLVYGFAGGMISGTFGTGGAAPVLAGLFAVNLPVKLAIGTSLMVVFINTFSALIGHSFMGKIDLTLVLFLTMGSILGAFTGAKLLAKVRIDKWERQIKYAFIIIILTAAMLLML